MTTRMGVSFAAILLVGTVLSCASAPPPESNVSGADSAEHADSDSDSASSARAEPGSSYDEAAANASANTCADRPCYSNSDCCKGASCGLDPERSHVQRYCLGF
ncbi:MAG: hypothetical protein QM756_40750 [Polyangiaceae bacterium]